MTSLPPNALHVVIEADPDGGYVGHCPEKPGAFGQGETIEEAYANTVDAMAAITAASVFRLVICGSRDWQDGNTIGRHLANLLRSERVTRESLIVVHGGALGADRQAELAARHVGIRTESWPADWATHGRKAGPIRNSAMMKAGAEEVWAFKDDFDFSLPVGRGRGTEDAVRMAMKLGIPTFLHWHERNSVHAGAGLVNRRRQLMLTESGVVASGYKGRVESDIACE
jgi:predicted RNase H-like HicB family nuclease